MTIPVKYNLRNLLVRKVTTTMTVLGISLVVATFVALMAMAHGLNQTLVATGVPENAILVRKGALADAASSLTIDQYRAVRDLPQLASDARRNALASPELIFQIQRRKKGGGTAMVLVRGVRPVAFSVHSQVKVSTGRMPSVRSGELLVGSGLRDRFEGFDPGSKVRLFSRDWTVVGVMECDGCYYESELWCDLDDLASDSRRSYYSAIFVKLRDPASQAALKRAAADDPRIDLEAKTELAYFEEQSEGARRLRLLGLLVAGIMAIGAVFAAMNTMYAAISARTKEIATLRALGFSRVAITASFVAESMLLALAGGVVGCVLALPVHGTTTGTVNLMSFSDVSFSFAISPGIVGGALAFSLLIGFFGGLLPARTGAAVPIVQALRQI
ncbi:MAG: ABC transporter permease [Candidatus Riflebacteria bacterium]|nr:ABC transporter permease [Candidatus Riflebacteria bacterium]